MNKINVTTVSAVATSATVVQAVIPEYQKSKAVKGSSISQPSAFNSSSSKARLSSAATFSRMGLSVRRA